MPMQHRIVPRQEGIAARKRLLPEETGLTRLLVGNRTRPGEGVSR
jgi:hypothetical protein